jgi:hypothetical protein
MSPISTRPILHYSSLLALAGVLLAFAACDKSESTGPGADKLITIASPAAGSTWKVGDSLSVQWSVKDHPSDPSLNVEAVDIYLSADGGANWGRLNTGSIPKPVAGVPSPKWGNYKWKIADSLRLEDLVTYTQLKGKTNCRVRIEQYTPKDSIQVTSTGNFTISP